jgi:hypothetical protein
MRRSPRTFFRIEAMLKHGWNKLERPISRKRRQDLKKIGLRSIIFLARATSSVGKALLCDNESGINCA